MVLRRMRGGGSSGGGFSSSASTVAHSMRDQGQDITDVDEVDEAIDPEQVREHIQNRALAPLPTPAPPDRDSPASRMNQVANAGSMAYAKEYRLDLLSRLLTRRIPLDQIARQLGVSISTIEKDRAELKRRFREKAKDLSIDEIIGGQDDFYSEVTGLAMRIASSSGSANRETGEAGVPTAMKLAAMRTALASQADRNRFYVASGVYDVLQFRRGESADGLSDVQLLMQRTAEMFATLDNEPDSDEAAPKRSVVRRKPNGFSAPSFDDPGASSGDSEIQEL